MRDALAFAPPPPLAGVPAPREVLKDDYFDGAIWAYHAKRTNEAGQGASDITFTVTPGAGNELEVGYGSLFNGDTVSRAGRVEIDLGSATTNQIADLIGTGGAAQNITSGRFASFPTSDGFAAGGVGLTPGFRFPLAGTMRLAALLQSVADGQDADFSLVARITGSLPDVVEAGAGAAVVSNKVEQVF